MEPRILIFEDNDILRSALKELLKDRMQRGCKAKYRALMSGDWTDSNLKYAQEIGCRVFHKPFDFKELIQWLDVCKEEIKPERSLSNLFIKLEN